MASAKPKKKNPRLASGRKRARQDVKLNAANTSLRSKYRTAVKNVEKAVARRLLCHPQVIVPREVDDEIPGHGIVIAQVAVDDDGLHAVDQARNAPGRITQVAAQRRAAGAEGTHHAREALGPVARPEGSAIPGDALDEDFFGAGSDHSGVADVDRREPGIAHAATHNYSILYKTCGRLRGSVAAWL